VVQPLPEGDGEFLNGDGPDDPFPDVVDVILGEGKASQLLLHPLEQELVCRRQIRQKGRVLEHLDGGGGKQILHNGGSVNRGIIPVEKPLLFHYNGALLLQILHGLAQGHGNVVAIDGDAPGDDVDVDQALSVKEHHHHLFCSADVDWL
jgi:hypothetical protein